MLIRSTWTLTTQETATIPKSYCLELVKQLHQQIGLEIGQENIPSTSFSGLLSTWAKLIVYFWSAGEAGEAEGQGRKDDCNYTINIQIILLTYLGYVTNTQDYSSFLPMKLINYPFQD